eukprot:1190771-Pleurochrysis_carterae.AAC.2
MEARLHVSQSRCAGREGTSVRARVRAVVHEESMRACARARKGVDMIAPAHAQVHAAMHEQ